MPQMGRPMGTEGAVLLQWRVQHIFAEQGQRIERLLRGQHIMLPPKHFVQFVNRLPRFDHLLSYIKNTNRQS